MNRAFGRASHGLVVCAAAAGLGRVEHTPKAICDEKPPATQYPSGFCTGWYPANNPYEDRFASHDDDSHGGWRLFSVHDGHGGWQMADFSHKTLIPEVKKQYDRQKTYFSYFTERQRERRFDSLDSIQGVLLGAFAHVEKQYLDKVKEAFPLGFGELAKVGSCVLLVMHKGNQLVVANCGDCRAVLGTEGQQGSKHYATRLTHDHNSRVPLEALRLLRQHPGEQDIIVCKSERACYVKGRLQLTRALGDG